MLFAYGKIDSVRDEIKSYVESDLVKYLFQTFREL
jgi:hypothetical protein